MTVTDACGMNLSPSCIYVIAVPCESSRVLTGKPVLKQVIPRWKQSIRMQLHACVCTRKARDGLQVSVQVAWMVSLSYGTCR